MKKESNCCSVGTFVDFVELTGCHSADSSVPSSSNQETSGQAAGESFNETGYPIVNEPLTLKVMFAIRDTDVLIRNRIPCRLSGLWRRRLGFIWSGRW